MPNQDFDKELDEIVGFLCGSNPLDGVWFGDVPEGKPRYWWRAKFKKAIHSSNKRVEQKPVGDAIEIKVPKETMKFVMSKIKLKDKTTARRVLEPEWRIKAWRTGSADKYDLEVQIWKLKILASLTRKYNWAIFLLEPDNLPKVASLKETDDVH